MVQLSHPYMTTGKTIALTRLTFVGEVMSLLFNMLPRLVIAFLPRRKSILISWLQSPSAVILEPKKIKFHTVSIISLSICHEVMGLDAIPNSSQISQVFCRTGCHMHIFYKMHVVGFSFKFYTYLDFICLFVYFGSSPESWVKCFKNSVFIRC